MNIFLILLAWSIFGFLFMGLIIEIYRPEDPFKDLHPVAEWILVFIFGPIIFCLNVVDKLVNWKKK